MKYTDLIVGQWYSFKAYNYNNIGRYKKISVNTIYMENWISLDKPMNMTGAWNVSSISNIAVVDMEEVYKCFPEERKSINLGYEIY